MGYDGYMICHECKEFTEADGAETAIVSFLYKHKNCGSNYWPTESEVKKHDSAVHMFATQDLHQALVGDDFKSFDDVGWNEFKNK